MSDLAEKSDKNAVTQGADGKKWHLIKNREARLRDLKHFELAYEWLKSRGKIVIEN
ncbi:MAG TPA: hypothetical protein VLZ03_01405 [Thermodesulfobacteriota bacterium]|nr:hypothetical protein [Thermodesulfobacteriota bacterium]